MKATCWLNFRPAAPGVEMVCLAREMSLVKTGNGCSHLDASLQGPCFLRHHQSHLFL